MPLLSRFFFLREYSHVKNISICRAHGHHVDDDSGGHTGATLRVVSGGKISEGNGTRKRRLAVYSISQSRECTSLECSIMQNSQTRSESGTRTIVVAEDNPDLRA